jgi:hypothetical protein
MRDKKTDKVQGLTSAEQEETTRKHISGITEEVRKRGRGQIKRKLMGGKGSLLTDDNRLGQVHIQNKFNTEWRRLETVSR